MEDQTEEKKNIFQSIIDGAILISIITGVIYLISFLYIKGFYNYYGLFDIEFDFSLFRVLKIFIEMIQPLLSWILIYGLLSIIINKALGNSDYKSILNILWFYILCLMFGRLARFSSTKGNRLYYTILFIALTVLFVICVIVVQFMSDKIKNKLSDSISRLENNNFYTYYKILYFLGAIYIIISFVPKYGFNEAKTKKDYLYDFQNNRILIYQDNTKSVFLPKLEDESFEKKYIFINTSDLSDIVFGHYEKEVVFKTNENDLIINSENIDEQSEIETDIVEEVFK